MMLYLLYGPDEFTRTEALAQIKAQVPPDLADLNVSALDGRRLKADALAAACEAIPFIAERRVVVVYDLLKHQKAGKDREELRAYLERVPATCDLVLVESEEFDRRSALFTYLKKAGELHEFLPKEGAELLRWVAERARLLGVTIDQQAAQRLVALAGSESRALINEIAKLAAYVGGRGRITAQVVDLLVSDDQEQSLFAFIDEVGARRRGPALAGLRRLLEDGQAATYILFMLARHVRVLLGVKELAAQRLRPDDIAARLGQRPFVVRKALEQARGFSEADLLRLHDRVLALDHATKTGRFEAAAGLELLVAELCA
jgi:DNA polymerase-3 subunit delta